MIERASLPDFELPATGNPRFQLSPLSGHPVPCSLPHSAASHGKFRRKMSFTFELPRDPEEKACAPFAVTKTKNMDHHRQERGIGRGIFGL